MELKIKRKNSKFLPISLLIFLVIYILFSIEDMSASAQMGYRGVNRSRVYVYLIMITAYLFLYFLFNVRKIELVSPLPALILLAVWTVAVNILNGVATWSLLVQGNMSVMWILSYLFFESVRNNEKTEKSKISVFVSILAIFSTAATVYYFFDMMIRIGHIPVLNVVYYLLALMPWICMNITRKQKNVWFIIILAVTLLSMKRGAIIAVPIMFLTDTFFDSDHMNNSSKTFFKTLGIIILFFIGFIIVDRLSDGYLSERFTSESLASGSGRREQFSDVLDELSSRGIKDLIIGTGSARCVEIFGTGIHNEWLSFLYNYGIVGFSIYTYLFFGFVKNAISARRKTPELASSAFMMVVLYFTLSMVSTGYGGYVGLWLFGFWGYLNAERKYRIEKKMRINEAL